MDLVSVLQERARVPLASVAITATSVCRCALRWHSSRCFHLSSFDLGNVAAALMLVFFSAMHTWLQIRNMCDTSHLCLRYWVLWTALRQAFVGGCGDCHDVGFISDLLDLQLSTARLSFRVVTGRLFDTLLRERSVIWHRLSPHLTFSFFSDGLCCLVSWLFFFSYLLSGCLLNVRMLCRFECVTLMLIIIAFALQRWTCWH